MRPNEAYEVLGLGDQAAPAAVKERWRALRGSLHPDQGGDAAEFIRVREAYEVALHHASGPQRCEDCEGSGKKVKVHGFSRASLRCPTCRGSGKTWREGAAPDEDDEHEDV